MISATSGISSCGISQGKIISVNWLLCYRFFIDTFLITIKNLYFLLLKTAHNNLLLLVNNPFNKPEGWRKCTLPRLPLCCIIPRDALFLRLFCSEQFSKRGTNNYEAQIFSGVKKYLIHAIEAKKSSCLCTNLLYYLRSCDLGCTQPPSSIYQHQQARFHLYGNNLLSSCCSSPPNPQKKEHHTDPCLCFALQFKILERLLLPTLQEHLTDHKFQHGFRKNHSTVSALNKLIRTFQVAST